MSEEEIMLAQESNESLQYVTSVSIPHFLIDDVINETQRSEYMNEWVQIANLYHIYQNGTKFLTEGSNNDYVPSKLKYKKAAMIINKEARFFFSNPPSFNVNPFDVDSGYEEQNTMLQHYLDSVFESTNFKGKLLKGLKDCFIGKRVAIVVNFDPEHGVTIDFLNSLSFVCEYDQRDEHVLTKFVGFVNVVKTSSLENQRWFRKVYTKEDDGVYIQEQIYDGLGDLVENVTLKTKILFSYIPVTVVINDGLTGDLKGISELALLTSYEQYYSKLANADMDAERKSMHPIRYTVDASQNSTKNLSSSPGSYWDLQTDENKVNENNSAKVGVLEPTMAYSDPLKTTLDRIENEMFEEVDVPNITSEQLAGVITSGKTIQALYWGLTVRCDEKMLAWGYSLRFVAQTIIEGGILYPNCVVKYTDGKPVPNIPVKIVVENNYPIPEDVKEEKETDMAEVELKIRSRKSYNQKWRTLSDKKADEELDQIKKEQNMLEPPTFSNFGNNNVQDNNQGAEGSNKEDKEEDKGE